MASLLSLLMLSLPVSLLAANLTCQLTDIQPPTVESVALQTQQIHTVLTAVHTEFKQQQAAYQLQQAEYQQQVEKSLQDLKKALEDLVCIPTQRCLEIPTYGRVTQNDVDSGRPGEKRRLACGPGQDTMMIGMSDDNAFTDLDKVKCVHYASIHLGEEQDLSVPTNSDEYVSCGPNEVVTAFGSSDKWMTYIVHVTCRNVTSGAVVSDECQDFAVTASQGATEYHAVDTRWPAQCPGDHPNISVVTGIVYNQGTEPRWQKLRCCQLRATVADLP